MTTSQPMGGAAPDLPAPAATRPKEPGIDAVARAAVQQNIPTRRLLSSPYLQLGHGSNRSRFGAHMSSSTAFIATQLTIDKPLTSFLLTAAGIPVPDGSTVTSMEEAVEVARHIGYPVVCKPTDSNRSLGVFTNIQDESTLREWFPDTLTESPSATAVIQQHVTGSDYRVLTIGNSIAAIFKRIPAFVVGNGSSTIGELIDIENQTPERQPDSPVDLHTIRIDNLTDRFLLLSGRSLATIPYPGENVTVRPVTSIRQGGIGVECTDAIHPDNADLCLTVSRTLGLDICGIDIVTRSISESIYQTGGAVLEANFSPGLYQHLAPGQGRPRDIGRAIVDMLHPSGRTGEVKIIGVHGPDEATVRSNLANWLETEGASIGSWDRSELLANGVPLVENHSPGDQAIDPLLANPEVDIVLVSMNRESLDRVLHLEPSIDLLILTDQSLPDPLRTLLHHRPGIAIVAPRDFDPSRYQLDNPCFGYQYSPVSTASPDSLTNAAVDAVRTLDRSRTGSGKKSPRPIPQALQ